MKSAPSLDAQQVFSAQYTAIMLIILTFVVGAFSQPKIKAPEIQPGSGRLVKSEITSMSQVLDKSFGSMTIENAFNPESNGLRTEQLAGVVLALKSHDIKAQFTVVSQKVADAHQSSTTLIAQMISTYRWLESIGIPAHAYQLAGQVSDGKSQNSLRIDFSPDSSHE